MGKRNLINWVGYSNVYQIHNAVVKSKIKSGFIFWFVVMLALTAGLFIALLKLYQRREVNGLWTTSWTGGLLVLVIGSVLIVLKDFKYLIIDGKKRTLKWFSLFAPFGRKLQLENYIGIIESIEVGSAGPYRAVYLVDRKRKTSFKLNGLVYKNFGQLCDALGMKKIRTSNSSFGRYIRLLITGRVKV